MIATELVGKALLNMGLAEPLPQDAIMAVCCISGELCPCIERRLLIGESFTTQGTFMAPDSDHVSVNAWYAFKHRPERAGNWFCDGEQFVSMNRAEVREKILLGFADQKRPWAMYVTTSFKKHGSLVAPVNQPGLFAVGFETEVAVCHQQLVQIFNDDLLYWQRSGIVRSDLQAGRIMDTRQADTAAVIHFDRHAQGRRHMPLYKMLAYLLPWKDSADHSKEDHYGD